MKAYSPLFMIAIIALSLGGCTTLLRGDAKAFGSTIGDLYRDQTLDNLAHLIDDPEVMLSLSDLDKGSVETDRSFNPTVSIPFGNQVATTVVGNAGETITAPSRAFTLGGSIGDKLTLGVEPVIDPSRLRNIAALYRYVIYHEKADPKQESPAQTLMNNYNIPYEIDKKGNLTVDKSVLLYPQCVICLKKPEDAKEKSVPLKDIKEKNIAEINTNIGSEWLHHETDPSDHSLGLYSGHYLSMPNGVYNDGKLRNLILLTMPSQPPKSN